MEAENGKTKKVFIRTNHTEMKRSRRTAKPREKVSLADTGYMGIQKIHANSQIPAKKSKLHPLTPEQKASNRTLASQRIFCEYVIGRSKVFHNLSNRYRNRLKRFGLRFNLIAVIYNLELQTKLYLLQEVKK
jgi:hypothetical protein